MKNLFLVLPFVFLNYNFVSLHCNDSTNFKPTRKQRGDYWVLYNYIQPETSYNCYESVTYTTHADFSFLDNLVPLLERWNGPISIALHAPGSDFKPTVESIRYLRDCSTHLMKKFVTFHVYFSTKHIPSEVPKPEVLFNKSYNCEQPAPFWNVTSAQMYKSRKNLHYPINVGRNIARESAQTHYILPSDIELYPSLNIIPQFLEMISLDKNLQSDKPKVFPLPVFEVEANQKVPESKTQLQKMLKHATAVLFHEKLCLKCHNIPMGEEWLKANETRGLHVFHVGKRTGKFASWEPIFIGTHDDPLYDERLDWEGKSDKMPHAYALCVLDYDFMILDNAFLVHKPGVKEEEKDDKKLKLAVKRNQLIKRVIHPELMVMYGVRQGCVVK